MNNIILRMEVNPFDIKDFCRNKLTKYLIQAISILPSAGKPLILDIGCGSGFTDEYVWWNDYYQYLEASLLSLDSNITPHNIV